MSRLIFAAARGARIQTQYQYPKKHWGAVNGIRTDDFYPYRIHPNDEHLQYGPITSAWRKSAMECDPEVPVTGLPYLEGDWDWGDEWVAVMQSSAVHFDTFLLILAEALADEGL